MIVPLTATPIFDAILGFAPTWSRDASGYTGRTPYRVNTSEPDLALAAPGLPAIGGSHPSLPGVLCRSLGAQYVGGGDNEVPPSGWSAVWAEWATPSSSTGPFDPQDGDAYTEFTVSVGQSRIRQDAAGAPLFEDASKEAAQAELVVRRFASDLSLISAFLGVINRGNSNALTIPPIFGLGAGLAVLPRQLLARTFETRAVRGGLIELRFRFGFGQPGWYDVTQVRVDANGQPTGPATTFNVQGDTAFPAGLFA